MRYLFLVSLLFILILSIAILSFPTRMSNTQKTHKEQSRFVENHQNTQTFGKKGQTHALGHFCDLDLYFDFREIKYFKKTCISHYFTGLAITIATPSYTCNDAADMATVAAECSTLSAPRP